MHIVGASPTIEARQVIRAPLVIQATESLWAIEVTQTSVAMQDIEV